MSFYKEYLGLVKAKNHRDLKNNSRWAMATH